MSLLLLALLAPAEAQDAEVLLVGNSYTSRNGLPGITAAWLADTVPGWAAVESTSSTAGGKTLPEHAADLGDDTALAQYLVTAPGDWAFVTLQDQSQIPGFPQDQGTWLASRDAAVELAQAVRDAGSEPVFFQTWGRRVGDGQNPDIYPDYATMQDRITAGYAEYRLAASADGPVWIAPVGEVFRAVHDAEPADPAVEGTAFWELYSSDGSHPSLAGTAVAAATFVATFTGRRPEPFSPLADQGLETERQDALLDAVASVVLDDPTGPLPFPWLHRLEDWPAATPVDGDVGRPLVLLDPGTPPAAEGVDLTVGDGRVWVTGPEHTLGRLDVLDDRPGTVILDGGLRLDALDLGTTGQLDWRAGTLSVVAFGGDLVVPAAGRLALDSAPTTVDGTLSGSGTVAFEGTPGDEGQLVLLAEDGLDLTALTVELGPDLQWEVRRGVELWVLPVDVATRGRPGGCGCAHAPNAPGWGILGLFLLLARVRGKSAPHTRNRLPLC